MVMRGKTSYFSQNRERMNSDLPNKSTPLKEKLHEIIFEADTPAGKAFDVWLLIFILASVLVVILDSVPTLHDRFSVTFAALEWIFTGFFTIEYLLRLYCVLRPIKYATSFFGVVDLLSVLPSYLSLLVTGTQYFMVIRGLRLLRVFRIFKLGHFLNEGIILVRALKASRAKITVFITFVLFIVELVQYSEKHLLGYRHPDDGGLRRYHPFHQSGPVSVGPRHDPGLCRISGSNGHRIRGIDANGKKRQDKHSGLPALQQRRS